jgi:hypothetical protein
VVKFLVRQGGNPFYLYGGGGALLWSEQKFQHPLAKIPGLGIHAVPIFGVNV